MAKILLVEDDKSLREIYGVRLMAEGYEIVSGGDGEEALAMAIKERPDLIVSDVMMPKISGFDMLDILRSTTETKDVKVIMMTALSSDDQRARGEALGADRYLVKSQVGIEDVVRTVHDVLGDSIAPAAPVAPAVPTLPPADTPVAPTPAPIPVPAPTPEAFATPAPAPLPEPVVFAPAPAAPITPEPFTPITTAPVVTDAYAPVQAPVSDPVATIPTVPVAPDVQFTPPSPVAAPVAPTYQSPVAEPAATAPAPFMPTPAPEFTPAAAPSPFAPQPATPTNGFTQPPATANPVLSELPRQNVESQLPQPTAPFSSPAPASLGDRVIQPLTNPSNDTNDIASQMEQALNSSPSQNQGPLPPAA